jgi:hypothetical protein
MGFNIKRPFKGEAITTLKYSDLMQYLLKSCVLCAIFRFIKKSIYDTNKTMTLKVRDEKRVFEEQWTHKYCFLM